MARGRAGGGPRVTLGTTDGLAGRRAAAAKRFAEVGYPTTRQEAWRFSDISPIANARFTPAPDATLTPGAIAPYTFGKEEGVRLTFVNGRCVPELSALPPLPPGVTLLSLSAALKSPEHAARIERHLGTLADAEENPFVALNMGSFDEGAYLFVPKGCDLGPTVHLLHLMAAGSAGSAIHPRTLLVVEDGARAKVVEQYAGLEAGAYFVNPVTEVVVGANAGLTPYKGERRGPAAR